MLNLRKNPNSNILKRKLPFGILLSSIVIAFFCDVKAITSILVAGSPERSESESGPMTYLYLFSVLGALVLSIINSQWKNRRFSNSMLFILVWVSVFYIITYYSIAPPFTSFLLFSLYTVVSFTLPSIAKIDGRLFLKASMFFVFPAIFQLNQIFRFMYDDSEVITMGQSYAFLYPVIASVVYYFVYFKEETKIEKAVSLILFAVNSVFASYLIAYGSRGPVLSIIAVIAFCLVFPLSESGFGIKALKGRFTVFAVTTVVVVFSFISVIQQFQDVLGNYGLSFNFVDKILRLDGGGDVTNGRQLLYGMALTDIADNPIFGMGFDQFNNNHGIEGSAYPHNFIIQTLYDGGILLLIVLAIPIIKGFTSMWKTCTLDEYAVIVALAFSAVPRAMYSGDLWQNGPLWMLFGIVLCNKFVVRVNR